MGGLPRQIRYIADPQAKLPVNEKCLLGLNKHKAQCDKLLYHIGLYVFFGSGGRGRTYDKLINSQLLYH